MTLSEDIASVSDAKFVDAKTGEVLTGGAVSVSVDPLDHRIVNVNFSIPALGSAGWAQHQLVFYATDKSNN